MPSSRTVQALTDAHQSWRVALELELAPFYVYLGHVCVVALADIFLFFFEVCPRTMYGCGCFIYKAR
jgi:hypothetical protein